MKASLIIAGIWSAVLLFLSLAITGAFGPLYSGSFYPFTLPFIISTAVLVALVIAGLIIKRARAVLFWIVIPLHGLLFLPFHFAITRWPGGDDGPGMAWLCLVGGGSCIAGVLAPVLAITGVVITVRRRKGTEPATGEYSHVPRETLS
jgi:hypothetical protein